MNRTMLEEYDGPMDDQMLADLLNYSGQYPQEYMAASYGQPQSYEQPQYEGPMTDQMVADLPSFSGPGWGMGTDGTPTLTLAGNAGNAEFQGLGKYTSPADFAARDPAGFAKVNPQLVKTMPARNATSDLLDFAKNDPSVSIAQAKLMFNYEKSRQPGSESAVDIMRRNGNNVEQAMKEMQLAGMGNTAMQESYNELLKQRAQEARLMKAPTASVHLSEVVDPQNPSQMLRIDVSQYRGGSLGAPGVVGVSKVGAGGVAKREEAVRKGQIESSEILDIANEAEKILPKAHGSGVGAALGSATNFLGIDDPKNAADAQLRVLSGALVSKMPRMQGPQSDKDVAMYKEMAGMVGDASLPSSVRISALQTVKKLYGKYATQGEGAAPAAPGAAPTPAPDSSDYQQTLFNAKKAIARNPAAREAILRKLRDNGYDTKGL